MIGAGIVGAGGLRLLPAARANGLSKPAWLHTAVHAVRNTRATNLDFTREAWIRVPAVSPGVANVTCSGSCTCVLSSGTTSGIIFSGLSDDGRDSADCRWLISSDTPVSLSFKSFRTETEHGYLDDYVIVNQCQSISCSTKTRLAKLSGRPVLGIYKSITGYLEVVLQLGGGGELAYSRGFVASWETGGTITEPVSFVLSSTDYALAMREIDGQHGDTTARVLWPIFFATTAPPQRCVEGPLVLTHSTGSIGDGPGLLTRPMSCSWILAPGGGNGGGFQGVMLFFTEFLLTSRDSLVLASCLDISCLSVTAETTLTGATLPRPFVSTTPAMLVRLVNEEEGAWVSSAGFTASYAGMPTLPEALRPGLAVNVWHHIALSATANGSLSFVINGTQQLAQLTWDPVPTQSPLTSGTDDSTAIGRGAPTWQKGGDFGYAGLEVDELRFWNEARTVSEIASVMHMGCQDIAAVDSGQKLAACYSFDAKGATNGGENGAFFPDASKNQIPAFTAAPDAPYLPWCMNMDDDGEVRLEDQLDSGSGGHYNYYDWSENDMWGYCKTKPRLPGAGFDYDEAAMEEAAALRFEGTADVLENYPGCGEIILR